MPEEAVVGDIRQRMADGRKLPVKHRDQTWFVTSVHRVLKSIVTMRDGNGFVRRHKLRQSFDQSFHLGEELGLGVAILLRPAVDLPLKIVARPAISLESDRV